MKKLLAGLGFAVGLAIAAAAWAQSYYNIYGPVAGVQYNTGSTPFNTAATAAQIASPFGCTGSQALGGAGGCLAAGGGTVTSVGLTVPSWETVSGSPVTGSGTLAVTAATGQTANQFLATPNGSTGAVSLRAIVGADVPPINLASTANGGITGILAGANGGTSNGFFAVSGPATSLKTFTFPNASATVLTTNAAVTPTQGGTGLTSYTLGDTLYASAANTLSALAGNTTSTKKFLTQTGTGTVSAAPGWNTIAAGDIPSLGANPTATIGLSAVNGSAATYMTSDSAPPLSQAIAPTWTGAHIFQNSITASQTSGVITVNSSTSTNATGLFYQLGGVAKGRIGVEGTAGATVTGSSAGDMFVYTNGGNVLFSNGGASPSLKVGSSGNVTINAPSSGVPLAVTGLSGNSTLNVASSTGSAQPLEMGWNVGLSSNQWNVFTQSTDALTIGTAGAAGIALDTNSLQRETINSAGNVTVNAPSSGASLTVTGAVNGSPLVLNGAVNTSSGLGSYVAQINAGAGASGFSNGLVIQAGATSSDAPLYVRSQSGSTNFLLIAGDGGTTVGSPTGGDKGVGTINAQNLYVNGTAVATGSGVISKYAAAAITIGASTCTVNASQGNISGCTFNSTGNVTVNFSVAFSTGICTASAVTGNPTLIATSAGSVTGSAAVLLETSGGTATNGGFSITCVGS